MIPRSPRARGATAQRHPAPAHAKRLRKGRSYRLVGSSQVKVASSTESRPVLAAFPPRPSRLERITLCFTQTRRTVMKLFRREFLHLIAGAAAVPATAFRLAWAQKTSQRVRVATGLLATWQSTAWLGAEAGLFKKRGIDMTLPAIAVGGPEAAAGLIRGDWEFAHTGTVPVAEEVLKGRDIVILATPTLEFPNSFIMTRKEIMELAQLTGKKVGVLTESGQTSR